MKWDFSRNVDYFTSVDKIMKFHNSSKQAEHLVSLQNPKLFYKYTTNFLNYVSKMELPDVEIATPIIDVFFKRRSSWEFGDEYLNLNDFFKFIKNAVGTSLTTLDDYGNVVNKRNYPSGGALYPIKIYILNNNVAGLEKGIYEFRTLHSKDVLCCVKKIDEYDIDSFTSFKYSNKSFKSTDFIIFLASNLKMDTRYGLLQYRLTLLEAGHIAQNIMLMSTIFNKNCIPIGGFFEDKLNKFLEIDKINETVIYFLGVG